MRETDLGAEAEFGKLPAEVSVGRDSYYLVKDGERYRLLSRVCPHAGYLVEEEQGEFYCFMHGWSFDKTSGKCLNVPSAELASFDVVAKEGRLIALLP